MIVTLIINSTRSNSGKNLVAVNGLIKQQTLFASPNLKSPKSIKNIKKNVIIQWEPSKTS